MYTKAIATTMAFFMAKQRDLKGRFVNTHNSSFSAEYNIWGNMLYRCNNENSSHYSNYGGRGVRVCAEWHSYESFISDMGMRPTKDHSLERIDVNGNYCKSNCKWATKREQSRNRRNSRFIFVEGKKMQVDDYCEAYNVKASAIKSRIQRGWSNDRIINTPVRG